MPRASLVQDLYLGFEPRLRARRLAPWRTAPARLLFQLDLGESLDHPQVAAALETLAERIEVLAWEPRRPAADGTEWLARVRRLAEEGGRRFGEGEVFLGGHGLAAWIALASAAVEGVRGAVALAPSLDQAGAAAQEPSALRTTLVHALAGAPVDRPVLLLEGRDRPPGEAQLVEEWLARAPQATRLVAPSDADRLLLAPWPQLVAAWVATLAGGSR